MAFSACLRPYQPASSSSLQFKFCSPRAHGRHKTVYFTKTLARCCALHGINSVLGDRKSSFSSHGAPESARALLERLFAQTKKLDEQMNGNSNLVQDAFQTDFNLENFESDLHAALEVLRKKEDDLQEAETMVMLEHAELNQARAQLEQQEKEISMAYSKQEKLEEELRQANQILVSQARHIEDLKFQLKERDQEIAIAESGLSSKEGEIEKMRIELMRKNTEAEKTEAQLKSKALLLDEANEVVNKQEIELQELQTALRKKQEELEESIAQQLVEDEKRRIAETKLEKQTMDWLLAQEELKQLKEIASNHVGESNRTMEDFQRVRKLLADVRFELLTSRKSLVSTRQKMEEREVLLDNQLLGLEEEKENIMSYLNNLKNAQIEVESELAKLRIAEARNKELELDLSLRRDLLEDVQEELHKEKSALQEANKQLSSLQEELNKRNSEFEEATNLLKSKERDLVEANLEIQHLKFQQQSLQLVLQERDLELSTARNRLGEVNAEVVELRMLLNGKEDQLIQATGVLKEKEAYTQAIQHELKDAKLKASEAETVVARIVDLTNELVITTKEGDLDASSLLGSFEHLLEKPTKDFRWQKKQLETELELTQENLRTKETELLAAHRQISMKDEELKMVLHRLVEKTEELKELREEMLRNVDHLNKLDMMQQGNKGESNNIDDFAIEKLQLEAAQLEVEAASSALHKLAEMSRELLHKASLSIDADLDISVFPQRGLDQTSNMLQLYVSPPNGFVQKSSMVENGMCLSEVKSEVAHLSALTKRLVQEAGVSSDTTLED